MQADWLVYTEFSQPLIFSLIVTITTASKFLRGSTNKNMTITIVSKFLRGSTKKHDSINNIRLTYYITNTHINLHVIDLKLYHLSSRAPSAAVLREEDTAR